MLFIPPRHITGLLLSIIFMSICTPGVYADSYCVKSDTDKISTLFDGGKEQVRNIVAGGNREKLLTTASEVSFVSPIDTLTLRLDEWESAEVCMISAAGDSSMVSVTRRAVNPFENPSPEMRGVSPSGLLSREQAVFDVDALVDGISNVHPDMFSECRQCDFFHAVKRIKQSMPDSVSVGQLYLALTPLVAMLGDGHTHLWLPVERILGPDTLCMPVKIKVGYDRTLTCRWSAHDVVPEGAVIESINGIAADSIVSAMLPLVSGEREHFRLMRVDYDFDGLFHLMFPAREYKIAYRIPGARSAATATLVPVKRRDIIELESDDNDMAVCPYSYTVDAVSDVAVMDFRSFQDERRMREFADSMFRELRERNIGNLIIDLRNNGGGNSMVGDVLLRYISPVPFTQMDRILVRVTPLAARLMNARNVTPVFDFIEVPESDFIKPLSPEDGHYAGNVYLLTSGKTFSAAASFAWTFAECNIGTIIGEETGGMSVSYGDKLWYHLPVSDLECGISFKRFWHLNADEDDIHGAMPDVTVPASVALDKALSLIKRK